MSLTINPTRDTAFRCTKNITSAATFEGGEGQKRITLPKGVSPLQVRLDGSKKQFELIPDMPSNYSQLKDESFQLAAQGQTILKQTCNKDEYLDQNLILFRLINVEDQTQVATDAPVEKEAESNSKTTMKPGSLICNCVAGVFKAIGAFFKALYGYCRGTKALTVESADEPKKPKKLMGCQIAQRSRINTQIN